MKIGFAGNTSAAYYCLEKLCRDGHEVRAIIVPQGAASNANDVTDFASLAGEFDFRQLTGQPNRRECEQLGLDMLIKLEWPETSDLICPASLVTIGSNLAGQYCHGYLKDVAVDLYHGNFSSEIQLLKENQPGDEADSGKPKKQVLAFSEIELNLLDDVRSAKTKAIISFYNLLKGLLVRLDQHNEMPEVMSREPLINHQKVERVLDWRLDVMKIHNIMHALTHPGPGVQTWLDDSRLIIWRGHMFARSGKEYERLAPGTIVAIIEELGILVRAADGLFLITRIQPANAPEFPAWVWANQNRIRPGEKFDTVVPGKTVAAT